MTYASAKRKGLCWRCKANPNVEGKSCCETCLEIEKTLAQNKRDARSPRQKRQDNRKAKSRRVTYRLNHPDRVKASLKKTRLKLRVEVLSHYGVDGKPVCTCCGETVFGFLTLGHVNNDGAKERKDFGPYYFHLRKKGFPKGYRTECYNCNCGAAHNGRICPHKKSL